LRNASFIGKTSLRRIEPDRLQELIFEDLKDYPNSSISEINKRIGEEINARTLKSKLDEMLEKKLISKSGEKKGPKYFINIFS